ncbi:hypothetical protein ISN44_As06g035270 [Arabidopsis suecica]|uniref:DUF4283 domain-containing protein n=1 Tax=Arabidopsis suecica TaxID=45249 RepID=A0A8T2CM57_ARASU|nr:hypothetical protein ISN44_As06g035270 [Arabidopsis suecica]
MGPPPPLISVLRSELDFVVKDGVARISIPKEVIADAFPLWKNFVVGHFMGDIPHVGTIHATVNRIWTILEKSSKIDVQGINKTSVLFRIVNSRIRERVLKRKYWHISDIPLVISEWNPEASQSSPDLSAMPMWVDLRGVPGYLFSHQGLELLSSTVGTFVKLHPNTERCVRLDVARVLVEVNLQTTLTEKISFTNENGDEILVPVSYPWLPPKCKLCSHWGHKEKDCSTAAKVQILSKHDAGSKKIQGDVEIDSNTVKELAQSLLQDLALTPTLQLPLTVTGENVDSSMENHDVPEENQWTLVKSNNRKSPSACKGGTKCLIESLELPQEGKGTATLSTVNGVDGGKEDGEIIETEDGNAVNLIHENIESGETQESESALADHTSNRVNKANTGRSRSKARGPPKPIKQHYRK